MLPAVSSPARFFPFLSARIPVLLGTAVRGRKSRDDPPAKSKAGRIKYPPPVDPVELLVVQDRYDRYRDIMRALRAEFKEEMLWQKYEEEIGSVAEERAKQETEEHQRLMAWNNSENERLQKLREERIRQEEEEEQLRKLHAATSREKQWEEFIKEKEREILQLQEEAKNFITLENLDQRIEEALDDPKSYNFAIDKKGRIVKRTV
ncbi:28S ribosomal protein S26, mitochondrial [Latimeria chalumnae]|uniref:Small ribosomal subunit protein mS26 n=1 Tax=Latimeria chalumnae TaxID=7897 RepID=H3AVZ4_LATCH|nr:PREDICTED: 28S ribosomal protein S26, mitochondrial [Latimeria chalumnae]|eukprot:XP_005998716.1 PREDICTED: 28S ribosomal protein S26, mitochondrial [Latimeria chalumnae]